MAAINAAIFIKHKQLKNMKNFVSSGKTYDVILAAAILSGGLLFVGTDHTPMIAVTDGAIGDKVAFNKSGVYTLPKVAGSAIAQGVFLYWDATAGAVSTSSASGANYKLGWAFDPATSSATSINVDLLGRGQTA